VHQKWCGPCKPIVASLQRLYYDLDNVPLKFYTACADDIESLSDLVGDCKPLFLFFKVRRCSSISGL
jgi:thiol-disulfide isomerase/thioredoxin